MESNRDDLNERQKELAGYLREFNEDQLAAIRDLLEAIIKREALERISFNFKSNGLQFNVNMN